MFHAHKSWLGKFLVIFIFISLLQPSEEAKLFQLEPDGFELIEELNKLSTKEIYEVMTGFSVPFVVSTRSTNPARPGGVYETLAVFDADTPQRIDVDDNQATGEQGKDIEVIVEPIIHSSFALQVTIDHLNPSSGQTAQDLSILIAFPMNHFSEEDLAAPPYLYVGYSTRENDDGQTTFIPSQEQFTFTPNILDGTVHNIELALESRDTPDSVLYFSGFYQNQLILESPPSNPSLLDLTSTSLRLAPVPNQVSLALNASEILDPNLLQSELSLNWNASGSTEATISYRDNVGGTDDPLSAYMNSITINQMPTQEKLSINMQLNEASPEFRVAHEGNASIEELTIERSQISGNANQSCVLTDMPAEATVTLQADNIAVRFDSQEELVNPARLGAILCDMFDKEGVLNSDFQQLQSKLIDTPDLNMRWDVLNTTPVFTASTMNEGDFVGFAGITMATGDKYPSIWEQNPSSHSGNKDVDHILAFEDDEEGFRFAAGFVKLKEISYQLNTDDITSSFNIDVVRSNHLTLEVLIDADNATVLSSNQDVEAHCEIHDVPQMIHMINMNFIDQWNYVASEQDMEAIECEGFIGTKEYTLTIEDLPEIMNLDYQADDHLNVSMRYNDHLGLLDLFCHDPEGIDGTEGLFDEELKYAHVRVERAPAFTASWNSNESSFNYSFDTTNPGETLRFIQVAGAVNDLTSPLPVDDLEHYAYLVEQGGEKEFGVKLHEIDSVSISKNNDIGMSFNFAQPAPRPFILDMLVDSMEATLLPVKQDLAVHCEIRDVPQTMQLLSTNFVDKWDYIVGDQGIETITCSGSIGTKEYALAMMDLPKTLSLDYEADEHFRVIIPPDDKLGLFDLFCHDPQGIAGTNGLFGEELRYAHGRIEDAPAFETTWNLKDTAFNFNFDTPNSNDPLGLIKVAGAINNITTPSDITEDSHYAYFTEQSGEKEFGVQLQEIDTLNIRKNSEANVEFDLIQTSARPLHIFLKTDTNSILTGPNKGVSSELHIFNTPRTIDFDSNLSTHLDYNADSAINRIDFEADITFSQNEQRNIETTHIDGLLTELPTNVSYTLRPEKVGNAEITSNGVIERARIELTSNTGVLQDSFKHILIDIQEIPSMLSAKWDARSQDEPEAHPHANLTSNRPVGSVRFVLSRDNAASTPEKYEIFREPGGAVQYSSFAREIDRRYFRDGDGDSDERERAFMERLDGGDGLGGIYGAQMMLDLGEDHLIYLRDGDDEQNDNDDEMRFLSIQATGVECLSAQIGSGSFQCITDESVGLDETNVSFKLSETQKHPFYVATGNAKNNKFLVMQVENVPDTASFIKGDERIKVDFNESPEDIIVYEGKLPVTVDSEDALKLIISDTPSFVHINWDLGFPGGFSMDASNPFEFLFLNQDDDDRTVANIIGSDLNASWGVESFEPEVKCETVPVLGIPFACSVFVVFVEAFVNFEATPGIDGFLNTYKYRGSVQSLQPLGPEPLPHEYVPFLTMLTKDYQGFDASVGIEMCTVPVIGPLPPHFDCVVPPPLTPKPFLNVDTGLVGHFELDWWDNGGDFLGEPDYVDNDPWHLYPLLHSHNSHLFPYSEPNSLDNDQRLNIDASGFGRGTITIVPYIDEDNNINRVLLEAIPDSNSYFAGWEGDVVSNDNPLEVTIGDGIAITAKFEPSYKTFLPTIMR